MPYHLPRQSAWGGVMARRATEDVTDTELAILQVLWDRDESTRRQITDRLYPGGGESHYATVQNLLGRLERKGFVRHERHLGTGVLSFAATVDRDELIRRRLQDLADKLCGGAVVPLVMSLVRSQPLAAAEVEELAAFLREQRRRSKTSIKGA
jgi:BlaI family transcriptional regulator, penicillinase repressor